MYKIITLGKRGSGKSTLVRRVFDHAPFNPDYHPTLGFDLFNQQYENIRLVIMDFSAARKYAQTKYEYYPASTIAIYCVDLSRPIHERDIKATIAHFKQHAPKSRLILVGTKYEQCQPENELRFLSLIDENISAHMMTSALNETGLDDLRDYVLEYLMSKQLVIHPQTNQNTWFEARQHFILALKQLPPEKADLMRQELALLCRKLAEIQIDKALAIEEFSHNCRGILETKHPAIMSATLQVAAVATILLLTTLFGFGIGFCLGLCFGPAAFISGFLSASATAIAVTSVFATIGCASGGLLAYSFFKPSRELRALNVLTETAHQMVDHIPPKESILS